ncbi:MAG: 50S ribosomal protein L32 [Caldisericia bacterium]|jgi:large subunit ribosomal protein L32|nr:50S ribosomal protein L32 [Caldisericia bacterium]
MGVPKKKKSKSRVRMRRAYFYKPPNVNLVECPHCHELIVPHRVCPYCGYYKGREIVAKEVEE